jgi:hypothetical protein
MAGDRTHEISALLTEAEEAHGAYEATELNGVYDEEWPRWYAGYVVEHGIGELIGQPITADGLERILASSYADFQNADPQPSEPWADYAAGRIAADV